MKICIRVWTDVDVEVENEEDAIGAAVAKIASNGSDAQWNFLRWSDEVSKLDEPESQDNEGPANDSDPA